MTFKTTDLCDEFSNELTICKQKFKSYGGKQAFSGLISTVKVLEDNVLVKNALETIPKGHVLVVDGGGSNNCALRSEEHTSELQSRFDLVCRLLLEKKKNS